MFLSPNPPINGNVKKHKQPLSGHDKPHQRANENNNIDGLMVQDAVNQFCNHNFPLFHCLEFL